MADEKHEMSGRSSIASIENILVEDRMRKDLGDINGLSESIKTHGLLHPIVVLEISRNKYKLIAGERRLCAAGRAGWKQVPVTVFDSIGDLESKSMELEENIKRQNLSIAEQARGVKELEELKQAIHGKAERGVNPDNLNYSGGFGRRDTAKLLDRSVGSVTQDIQIAEAIEFFPDLAELTSKSQILREYKRRKETIVLKALAMKEAEDRKDGLIDEDIVNADCRTWAAEQESESFDLIIADFPWGIDIEESLRSNLGGRDGKKYDDSEMTAFELMNEMVPELFRLLRDDRHMYFFFGIQYYEAVRHLLSAAGFEVDPVPLIWAKTHFTGPPTGKHWPMQWECMFFCKKGDRELILKSGGNVISCPGVIPSCRIHISQKPTALFHPLITASTVPGEIVLDPSAGSGAVFEASLDLGRRCVAVEKDEDIYLKMKDYLRALAVSEPVVITQPTCIFCGEPGTDIHVTSLDYEGPAHSKCRDRQEVLDSIEALEEEEDDD